MHAKRSDNEASTAKDTSRDRATDFRSTPTLRGLSERLDTGGVAAAATIMVSHDVRTGAVCRSASNGVSTLLSALLSSLP